MEHCVQHGAALGYNAIGAIVIYGSPSNYVARGFQSRKKHNASVEDGAYPAAMLVKELKPGAPDGRNWTCHGSPATQFGEEAQRFDGTLEPMEKKYQPSQEEFYIISHSFLQ